MQPSEEWALIDDTSEEAAAVGFDWSDVILDAAPPRRPGPTIITDRPPPVRRFKPAVVIPTPPADYEELTDELFEAWTLDPADDRDAAPVVVAPANRTHVPWLRAAGVAAALLGLMLVPAIVSSLPVEPGDVQGSVVVPASPAPAAPAIAPAAPAAPETAEPVDHVEDAEPIEVEAPEVVEPIERARPAVAPVAPAAAPARAPAPPAPPADPSPEAAPAVAPPTPAAPAARAAAAPKADVEDPEAPTKVWAPWGTEPISSAP